ncbi:hypothetical protein ACNKHP_07140 [Shigella boydii]
MAGLQGAGKTTSVGNSASPAEKHKKRVLVVPATFIARQQSNS